MRPAVLLFSLGLHISLAVFLFFRQTPQSKVSSVPLEISISEKSSPVSQAKAARGKGRSKGAGQTGIFPAFNAGASFANTGSGSFADSRSYDTSIDEIFGADGNKNWSFYREVYSRIDSELVFDSLLAQYSHFGRVNVQFAVTQTGLLKLENLKADAEDKILKVHVLRAISRSLSKPLNPVKFSKLESGVIFKAQFDFSFDEGGNFNKQNNFGRPVFVFKRSTIEKPVPEEMLDHLLSGGVTPNISLMYERWKKYNKKKYLRTVQFDPFEGYRRDPFYLL